MSNNLVTIVTSTYNKPMYLTDAFDSLLNQTFEYWQWWLILDIPSSETVEIAYKCASSDKRVKVFPGKDHLSREHTKEKGINRLAWIWNKYWPQVDTKYFAWLSDDDVLSAVFLERLLGVMRGGHVAYGICNHLEQQESGEWKYYMETGQRQVKYGPNCSEKPLGWLDGGQILQTTSSYRALGWIPPEKNSDNNRLLDGIYLNELSSKFEFIPVNEVVVIHRKTLMSEYTPVRK